MSKYSETDLDHLNHEYSPSEHAKRYKSAEEAIQGHIQLIERESSKVQNKCDFLIDYDVKYGSGECEVLDIYYKDTTAKNAPLFIYVHGGYWQALTKDSSAYCVGPLVNAGYRVMIVNYTLCPKKPLTHLIQEIRNCVKFCLSYGSKSGSESVSLCGHSAGAHLILSALSDTFFWEGLSNKEILKHIYLVSGVYNLTEIRYLSSVNNNNILGLNDENIKEVSPLLSNYSHLKPYDIKYHVFVGEYDSKTFQKHSKDISDHLKRHINEKCSSYQLLEGIDHFDIVENLRLSDYCITKTIIKDGLDKK